jgi:1-acyl-sn-glycerol-3-phosphate acyltransferase
MKAIFQILYRVWFYILAGVPVIVFFPLLLLLSTKEKYYSNLYWFARNVWSKYILFCMGCTPKKLEGSLELPEPPFVFVANHTSQLDVMLLMHICPHPLVFVGKKELSKTWLFGSIYKRAAVLVQRESAESRKQVYYSIKEKMDNKRGIAIFPEAGVPPEEILLREFRRGGFSMAAEHKLKIVVANFYDCKKRLNWTYFHGGPGQLRYRIIDIIPWQKRDSLEEIDALKDEVYEKMKNDLIANP